MCWFGWVTFPKTYKRFQREGKILPCCKIIHPYPSSKTLIIYRIWSPHCSYSVIWSCCTICFALSTDFDKISLIKHWKPWMNFQHPCYEILWHHVLAFVLGVKCIWWRLWCHFGNIDMTTMIMVICHMNQSLWHELIISIQECDISCPAIVIVCKYIYTDSSIKFKFM